MESSVRCRLKITEYSVHWGLECINALFLQVTKFVREYVPSDIAFRFAREYTSMIRAVLLPARCVEPQYSRVHRGADYIFTQPYPKATVDLASRAKAVAKIPALVAVTCFT